MAIKITKNNGFGHNGIADVKVTPNLIRIAFEDNAVFDVLPQDAPDYINSGRQMVTMSSDNLSILWAKPAFGTYFVRFLKFHADKDTNVPVPRVREASTIVLNDGRKWNVPDGLDMLAYLEITSGGKFSGYVLTYKLAYAFYPDAGNVRIAGYSSKKLVEFLEYFGVDFLNDTIPFSDNVLPFIEKLLKERNRIVGAVIEKGWIKSFFPAPEYDGE